MGGNNLGMVFPEPIPGVFPRLISGLTVWAMELNNGPLKISEVVLTYRGSPAG